MTRLERIKQRITENLTPLAALLVGFVWWWFFLVAASALLSGCMPTGRPKSPPPPKPEPVIVDPVKDEPPDDISLAVEAESSLVGTLYELLGDSGAVTIYPAEPIVVKKQDLTLTIRPGSRLNYELRPSVGSIEFSEPRPTVTVRKWGLKLSPRLARVDLSSDNTGTAHVESGRIKLSKRFSLAWDDEKDSAEQTSDVKPLARPFVFLYGASWCESCRLALDQLSGAETPFEVKYIDDNSGKHPSWVDTLPTFHWRGRDGWRQSSGWPGVSAFVEMWRASVSERDEQASVEWTFPGTNRFDLIDHLRNHPNHRAEFSAVDLEALSFDQLKKLHSQHHNETALSARLDRGPAGPPNRPTIWQCHGSFWKPPPRLAVM